MSPKPRRHKKHMPVAQTVLRIGRLSVTHDAGRYFVFDGLVQVNSFGMREDAVRFCAARLPLAQQVPA